MDDTVKVEAALLHEHVCQALADPKRIVILYLLAEGPQNVGDIAEALDSPQSTVSRRIIQALDLMRAMVMSSLNEQARLAKQLS